MYSGATGWPLPEVRAADRFRILAIYCHAPNVMGRLSAIRSEDPSLRGNLQQTVSNVLNMLNGDPALAPAMRAMRALADACGESSIGADTQANLLAIVAAE